MILFGEGEGARARSGVDEGGRKEERREWSSADNAKIGERGVERNDPEERKHRLNTHTRN